jgi:enamine deaminase RidA (YjgF/YER057c/UK114 family)
MGGQAAAIFAIIEAALGEAGFTLSDVVRTRMFVTDMGRASAVLAVHGALFHDIRPTATIVEVGALLEPSALVEIEVDAQRAG